MKKYFVTLLAFCMITGVVIGISLYLNIAAPRIENGGRLPEEIAERHYMVTGISYDDQAGGYHLSFTNAPPKESYAITLYYKIAEIWQGDTLIAVMSQDSISRRIYTAQVIADEHGDINLLIKTTPGIIQPGLSGYSLKTLFTSYEAQRPKIVIGTTQNTQSMAGLGNAFYQMLMGLYMMLMVGCLVLFIGKKSEQYLLTVCIAAACLLLYLVTAMESEFIRFNYAATNALSTFTNVLTAMSLAYTCVSLFEKDVPPFFKKAFSAPVFIIVTASSVAIGMLTSVYIYQFMRRVVLIPVLITMACALENKRPGSRMLFVAYSIMEGLALFLYVNNSVMDMPYSPFMMFVRVKEISNLIFMSACAIQIFSRFSKKFLEADRLSEQVSLLNIGLERKVEERTHQLVQEQEQKHNMMLNIFHDLRNPVFVLKSRLATMAPQSKEDREAVKVMAARVNYLERLINDLFLIAKLESGDVQYDQDYVDLSELYTIVLRDMAIAAEDANVTLHGAPAPAGMATWGDVFRLQQAIVNIVENAILYTPGGAVILKLEKKENRCLLSVSDTGKGISSTDLPKVFKRYYRTGSSDKRSSGLGLSIAHEIITAHLGYIHVESHPGAGSIFTIDLPYCETAMPDS